jgi:hypothetical protein
MVAGIAIKACLGMVAFWTGALFVVRAASAEVAPMAIIGSAAHRAAGNAACLDPAALCESQAGGADAECSARCESTQHKTGVCQSFDARPVECWCTNDHQRWGLVSPVCSN